MVPINQNKWSFRISEMENEIEWNVVMEFMLIGHSRNEMKENTWKNDCRITNSPPEWVIKLRDYYCCSKVHRLLESQEKSHKKNNSEKERAMKKHWTFDFIFIHWESMHSHSTQIESNINWCLIGICMHFEYFNRRHFRRRKRRIANCNCLNDAWRMIGESGQQNRRCQEKERKRKKNV